MEKEAIKPKGNVNWTMVIGALVVVGIALYAAYHFGYLK